MRASGSVAAAVSGLVSCTMSGFSSEERAAPFTLEYRVFLSECLSSVVPTPRYRPFILGPRPAASPAARALPQVPAQAGTGGAAHRAWVAGAAVSHGLLLLFLPLGKTRTWAGPGFAGVRFRQCLHSKETIESSDKTCLEVN